MGTFVIKTRSENSQFEYKSTTDAILISGSFVKDLTSGKVQSINGSCYRLTQDEQAGEYFGNFNGNLREGDSEEIRYSMSEMARRDANKVWDAIDEIEPAILGEDE